MDESVLSTPVASVAALEPEVLLIDGTCRDLVAGKHVLLLDTVTSSGSTLAALDRLAVAAGAASRIQAVAFVEGEVSAEHVIHLATLPVLPAE